MASAYLVEVLAIIDNLKLSPEEKILLNPDPLTDLYLAFAYYFPFVLYWGLAIRRYDYSWKDVFWIGAPLVYLWSRWGRSFSLSTRLHGSTFCWFMVPTRPFQFS